nr:tetratricopeptide repeat protein [Bacteroides intestinalis]
MEANIYYEQGQRSFYNGEYREAGKLLREAASLGLRDALFFMAQKADELNNRGVLYDKQGNIELANRYYKFAIELMPEDDDALLNLARNYEKAGKLQESISLCLKAIRISPERYMSYAIIGDVFYYGTDDVEQAVEWYKKAYKYGDWEIGQWLINNGYDID